MDIPNSVTTIGQGAFKGCSALASVDIPNSVTYIGYYAFEGCSSLTSVTIPNSVTRIGKGVFGGCSALASVTIPNSVTYISAFAFSFCSNLKSVVIPNSVTTIVENAFLSSGLTSIFSFNPIPPTIAPESIYIGDHDTDCFDEEHHQNATLYVPQIAVEAYKTTYPWSKFQNIVGVDPAGINDIRVDDNTRQKVFYDINGNRLNSPRHGLNIINGKKVIIR